MFSTPPKTLVVTLLCALLFAAGLAQLLLMRFEAGDLYPPYASLRSDPLGTRVFYESLRRMHSGGAHRSYLAPDRLKWPAGGTFMIIGLDGEWRLNHSGWEKQLAALADQGGRLVVAFRARAQGGERDRTECPSTDLPAPEAGPPSDPRDEPAPDEAPPPWPGMMETLGLQICQAEIPAEVAERPAGSEPGLPQTIAWRSPLCFVPDDPAWQVLYHSGGQPVVMERAWGAGSVLMCAGSYLFSNEALKRDRFPGLLARVVKAPGPVVFHEFHHGLMEQPGIASLVRKYRLEGFAAALLAVAALILWRQAAPFVIRPGEAHTGPREIETGSDTTHGLIRLMEQHIGRGELLRVCHEAWAESPAASRVPADRLESVRRLAAGPGGSLPRRQDNVDAYKRICELLRQGTHA